MTNEPADAGRRVWTFQQVHALGVTTDLVTAAAILGIGRTTAHALARADQFPVPVIRVGHRYRVPTAPILRLLAVPTEPPHSHPAITSPTLDAIAAPPTDSNTTGPAQPQARRPGAGGNRHPT